MLDSLFASFQVNISSLPDKILLNIFGFLKLKELCKMPLVCKKWRQLAYEGKLWSRVSLRPDHNGLQVGGTFLQVTKLNCL